MRRHSLEFDEFLKESLKDPEVKAAYERMKPEFAIIHALIDARRKRGVTQAGLAKKMKTTQSVISRVESGNGNPSIGFLQKLADALNANLEIKFVPR